MRHRKHLSARLMCGAAMAIVLPAVGHAEEIAFSIAPQPLTGALKEFGVQSQRTIVARPEVLSAKVSGGVVRAAEPDQALSALLEGTGLSFRREGDTFMIVQAGEGGSSPQGGGADVDALIVTAQKREENIQDVPIAISAFSQEALERSQIAGGPDLMTQIPNMTFTKTNFSGYSIQIRGIGTQAISATTDAAVAVAFNNTPFIRNRFFEQEFYDLERVEVLRGPQGTLYGRNATAGVVNIISAKPKFQYSAKTSADLANYNSTRIEGMVNIPLVEDAVALRLAGAWTKRDGFATNGITGNPIDGRDLWSTRVSLRLAPTDGIDVNLIWEHFQEADDRLRSGKQLCKTHITRDVLGYPVEYPATNWSSPAAYLSQGCTAASLYSPESFQTPNGASVPYFAPLKTIFLPAVLFDPYASRTQSRDLRVIESTVDPDYRAKSDVGELQISFDLTDSLTLASETAYSTDNVFSLQDYNRFNTASGAWEQPDVAAAGGIVRPGLLQHGPNGGIFCDPQIGCADRLVLVDLSKAKSKTFSQEFRLSSDFEGPLNFSFGANFLRYDTEDKYYVFINSATLISAVGPYGGLNKANYAPYAPGVTDNRECLNNGSVPSDPSIVYPVAQCTYIDPNPVDSLNDLGHNYFLSRNPYKLISYAAFGEVYYNITDALKITGGFRMTVDKKEAPLIPSWLLASSSFGYPVASVSEQEWTKPTGRLAIDWKPDLTFTDETLLYASYAHGYKAGGANPPTFVKVFYGGDTGADALALSQASATRPKTFDPEYVDALELGAKNTLFDGRVTLNLAGFYYDYTGYQISEIVDRSAFNRNFDATVWGLEIEADWRVTEALRLGFKGGYEKTRLADGSQAVDLMDRTAGHDDDGDGIPDWIVVKPFPTYASNCILPKSLFIGAQSSINPNGPKVVRDVGNRNGGTASACELAYLYGLDPVTGLEYVPNPTVQAGEGLTLRPGYKGFNPETAPNNGEGFYKQIGGNELPNAPDFTATLTADYTVPAPNGWSATVHADLYYQSESWWRVFNTPGYDKIKAYTNLNLSAIFINEEAGWKVMAYVKNVMDRDSITGAFLNSDDSGLTTNVFLTEPRLYGVRVTKEWTGGGLLGSFGERHEGPYPFTLELGGQVQRQDAPNQAYRPTFLNSFAPEIDPSFKQDEDLDWGDGRDIRLAYAMDNGWKVSLGARQGEANRGDRTVLEGQEFHGCTVGAPCDAVPTQQLTVTNYGATELYEREEHTLVDFLVGRDFGVGLFGALSDSTVAAGLRYAKLQSTTNVSVYGAPDWYLPPEFNLFVQPGYLPGHHSTHHEYSGQIDIARDFEGVGPVVSWTASIPLLDGKEAGRVDLDWSVSGGVLFGKQRASGEGRERKAYYDAIMSASTIQPPAYTPITTPVAFARSENVTVPTLGLSVGLSYKVDRFKVGAGYSWERYFDAIDGGVASGQQHDRTIDGPYFKLSVGFGG